MIMKFTKPLFLLSDSNQKTIGSPRNHCFSLLKRTKNAPQLAGDSGRIFGQGRRPGILANFRLSHQKFRAIDLSCRACGAGAGCWAWIPGWGTCGVHPQPPIVIIQQCCIHKTHSPVQQFSNLHRSEADHAGQ